MYSTLLNIKQSGALGEQKQLLGRIKLSKLVGVSVAPGRGERGVSQNDALTNYERPPLVVLDRVHDYALIQSTVNRQSHVNELLAHDLEHV